MPSSVPQASQAEAGPSQFLTSTSSDVVYSITASGASTGDGSCVVVFSPMPTGRFRARRAAIKLALEQLKRARLSED